MDALLVKWNKKLSIRSRNCWVYEWSTFKSTLVLVIEDFNLLMKEITEKKLPTKILLV